MSAVKKWALGGIITCIIGLIVFSTVFITGEMPKGTVMGIIGYVISIAGIFGVTVTSIWGSGPPSARAPPE